MRQSTSIWPNSGELWTWISAAALGLSICAVFGVVALIVYHGSAYFWIDDVLTYEYQTNEGENKALYAQRIEIDHLSQRDFADAGGDLSATDLPKTLSRWLIKTGQTDQLRNRYQWVFAHRIREQRREEDVAIIERTNGAQIFARVVQLTIRREGSTPQVFAAQDLAQALPAALNRLSEIRQDITALEQGALNRINTELETLRLERRRVELNAPEDLNEHLQNLTVRERRLLADYQVQESLLTNMQDSLGNSQLLLVDAQGTNYTIPLTEVGSLYRPNAMSLTDKLALFVTRGWDYLTSDPRESNTAGGVYPAIFGTVLMVLLMSIIVTPLGVMAAIYLHEYAPQGPIVRTMRIAISNLAGVPSIVYGVFGLGFFVYALGGSLDRLFFPEALPAPTFGAPGLVWASLTLALLTVPVVIVSTEEGLARIPKALREGSFALGATRAETLVQLILPIATPAILTGVILAVARAAGEVAPLMLVGVVKFAPALPIDATFPYLHLDRQFMHLGFHIYDLGFQSPNVEAARPLVYATALLLIFIVVSLNMAAITLRNRLERRYRAFE